MLADHPRGGASHAHAPLRKPEPPSRRTGGPTAKPAAVLADAGAMLRAARKRRGWTVRDLAVEIGVSHVHVSMVELGRCPVGADVLLAWAKALGMDTAEVCCAFRVVPEQAAERFFDPDRMRAALAGGGA